MRTADRLTRLDRLEARLKADEALTVPTLAAEFGVSARTLFRDLALLRDRGVPVEADAGRGGGVRIDRRWGVGRLALDYREAVDLLVSLAIAEQMGSPWLLANLAPVRRKLAASFSPALKDRIAGLRRRILIGRPASAAVLGGFAPAAPAVTGPLFAAFVETLCLDLTYADAADRETRRQVEPQRLLFNAPVWYLVAWDLGRGAARTFRLDRIRAAQATGAAFRLRPDLAFAEAVAGAGAVTP